MSHVTKKGKSCLSNGHIRFWNSMCKIFQGGNTEKECHHIRVYDGQTATLQTINAL